MLIRQRGPCAICQRQTVIETPCPDRRSRIAAERDFICDECDDWADLDAPDPDIVRLIAGYRDCSRDEDGW